MGTPAACTAVRARVLDPISSIAEGGGPMNLIPASAHARANLAFSDKNPYPGCMASAPHLRATSRILVMFKYDSRAGAGPSRYASSACVTCSAPRSTSEKTATVAMPISRQARITRTAISPRLAMRTLVNIAETLIVTIDSDAGLRAATPASAQQKAPPAGGALRIRVDYFDFGWSSKMATLGFFV